MTNDQHAFLQTIREFAENTLSETMREANATPQPPPETCEDYPAECDVISKLEQIRAVLERPHGDDSPCEDIVWTTADAIINAALTGLEQAAGVPAL